MAVVIAIFMLLFPPFVISYPGGAVRNKGYGFLFGENSGAIVNVGLLFAQWFIVISISFGLIYLNRHWTPQTSAKNPTLSKLLFAITEGWRRSKIFRTVCIGAIIIDLLFVMSYHESHNKVSVNFLIRAFGWTIFLITNFLYHALRAHMGMSESIGKSTFSIKRVLTGLFISFSICIALFVSFSMSTQKPWVRSWSDLKETEPSSIEKFLIDANHNDKK